MNGWPPEIDIGEWKGTAKNWYNVILFYSLSDIATLAYTERFPFTDLQLVLSSQVHPGELAHRPVVPLSSRRPHCCRELCQDRFLYGQPAQGYSIRCQLRRETVGSVGLDF